MHHRRRTAVVATLLLTAVAAASCAQPATPAPTTTAPPTTAKPAPPTTPPTTTSSTTTTTVPAPTPVVYTPAAAPTINADGIADGFVESTVVSGLDSPTALDVAADGRVFITEKSGRLHVLENLDSADLELVADLRVETYNHWDRGLLGVVADPQLTEGRPYIYVAYSYDAEIGGTAPRWGSNDPELSTYDTCPTNPGAMLHGCVSSARIERLTLSDGGAGNTVVDRRVLVHDFCMQFSSHTIGDIAVDDTGALVVSAGDGAAFHTLDWGQWGSPTANPCDDPPGGDNIMEPPHATGGTLRAQSVRRGDDQPVSLSGAVVRIDADTGAAAPGNPAYGHPNENRARTISAGHKNPYRFTLRPGTNEIWTGDVGLGGWEEINRIENPSTLTNFGFPCFEGPDRHPGYDAANLTICEELYADGTALDPFHGYSHNTEVSPGDQGRCPPGAPLGGPISSSITGLAFHDGGNYPAPYHGALFFADYARECIWVMFPGADGTPDPEQVHTFAVGAATPVQLKADPASGDLLYIDLIRPGSVRRISYTGADATTAPIARIDTTATAGPLPFATQFDASASTGTGSLEHHWDFGDGTTATGAQVAHTYSDAGAHLVRLRSTDSSGASGTSTVTVTAGGPVITAGTQPAGTLYRVGEPLTLAASAIDSNGDPVPAEGFRWRTEMRHCATPTNCHSHPAGVWSGVDGFTIDGPEHPLPSHLKVHLTATDSNGLVSAHTFDVHPDTVELTVSADGGTPVTVDADAPVPGPLTSTHTANSTVSVSVPAITHHNGTWVFTEWSDGHTDPARTVQVADDLALTARYHQISKPALVTDWVFNGSATDAGGGEMELTTDDQFLTGGVAATDSISGHEFHVSYTASFGSDPWGADGIALVLADADTHGPDVIGAPGIGLGYVGVDGVAVIADTYTNTGEPDVDFVGIADGADGDQPGYVQHSTAAGDLAGTTRRFDVTRHNGRLDVHVDGRRVLTSTVDLPETIRVMFTAATGGLTNAHSVSDVTVAATATPHVSPTATAVAEWGSGATAARWAATSSPRFARWTAVAPTAPTRAAQPAVLGQLLEYCALGVNRSDTHPPARPPLI